MFSLSEFKGEIPRLHPRLLPPGFAMVCQNAKMERGVLSPYRTPLLSTTLNVNTETFTSFAGSWIGSETVTDAVQGPVAADRLYYTGFGLPKVRLTNGTVYNLKWAPPTAAPNAALNPHSEYLNIDGRNVLLRNAVSTAGVSLSGLGIRVSVVRNVATITLRRSTGMTAAQVVALINAMAYTTTASASRIGKGLKVVKITSITDSGGQSLDASGDAIGSPTRYIDDVQSAVRLNGSVLPYSPPVVEAQDGTDVASQNDAPTLAATPLNPGFAFGDHPAGVRLFSGAAVSTVESGQTIIAMTITVDGLSNGILDQGEVESLAYAYTGVSVLDEESQPSPLVTLDWSPGQSVYLTGIANFGGSRLKAKRLYRAQTSASGVTDLYFIAEIPTTTSVFIDSPDETPLQEPLPSLYYDQPPDDLSGLIALPNGIMAAFVGRQLYFSEPYRPHAWPGRYMLTTDYPIVGLAAAGGTLIVLTTGTPYAVAGTHPENMQMVRVEVDAPCVSKRSIVDLGYAAAYASVDGLIVIDAQGGVRYPSRDLFTDQQWEQMRPSEMIASRYQGRYVLSYNTASGGVRACAVIDLAGDAPFVIRTDWDAGAFYYALATGRLYYRKRGGGQIYMADPIGGDYAQLRWRSAPMRFPVAINMGAALIEGDLINAKTRGVGKVYADGRLVGTVTKANQIQRLPGGFLAREWFIEVVANMQITSIHMARTVDELKSRAR